jgi:hypothetical protein
MFIDTDIGLHELVIMINNFLEGKIFLGDISSQYLSVYIMKNDDYDPIKKDVSDDGPLYYKYFLDIEPSDGVDFETYLIQIKKLIAYLREKRFKPIAACEFEDKLDQEGPNEF